MPTSLSPLKTTSLFNMSVSLFQLCTHVHFVKYHISPIHSLMAIEDFPLLSRVNNAILNMGV